MKYLILFFLSFSSFAQVNPVMDSGEVKITYPCNILSALNLEKEETENISFFELEKNRIYHAGFIVRKRSNPKTKEADFTVKFRNESPSFLLDEKIFSHLTDTEKGELKCEFDVNYHPTDYTPTYACSFKSETEKILPEHFEFIKMVKRPVPDIPGDLRKMKEVKVESTSWKLKLTREQKKESPFNKKPSVERWMKKEACFLEVSGKLTASSGDPKAIHKAAKKGFSFLQTIIKEDPAPAQGMKTKWALGENAGPSY